MSRFEEELQSLTEYYNRLMEDPDFENDEMLQEMAEETFSQIMDLQDAITDQILETLDD